MFLFDLTFYFFIDDSLGISIQDYSDTTCGTPDGDPGTIPAQCFAYGGITSFKMTACGVSNALDFSSNSFVGVNYQLSTCSEVVSATAFPNGYCISFYNESSSVSYTWPNINYYQSSITCSGTVTQSINVDALSCEANTDDYYPDNYNTYFHYTHVSFAISRFPLTGITVMVSILFVVLSFGTYF